MYQLFADNRIYELLTQRSQQKT